jgi:hypothetical protein
MKTKVIDKAINLIKENNNIPIINEHSIGGTLGKYFYPFLNIYQSEKIFGVTVYTKEGTKTIEK